jgi:hypothetical protein
MNRPNSLISKFPETNNAHREQLDVLCRGVLQLLTLGSQFYLKSPNGVQRSLRHLMLERIITASENILLSLPLKGEGGRIRYLLKAREALQETLPSLDLVVEQNAANLEQSEEIILVMDTLLKLLRWRISSERVKMLKIAA